MILRTVFSIRFSLCSDSRRLMNCWRRTTRCQLPLNFYEYSTLWIPIFERKIIDFAPSSDGNITPVLHRRTTAIVSKLLLVRIEWKCRSVRVEILNLMNMYALYTERNRNEWNIKRKNGVLMLFGFLYLVDRLWAIYSTISLLLVVVSLLHCLVIVFRLFIYFASAFHSSRKPFRYKWCVIHIFCAVSVPGMSRYKERTSFHSE